MSIKLEKRMFFNLVFFVPLLFLEVQAAHGNSEDSCSTGVACGMSDDDLIVRTPLGKVRGYKDTSRSGREYLAFSGLPYGKPPIDDLVFQPPKPVQPWEGVRVALEDGPWCIQYNMFQMKPKPVGVQDCLYLSIYTHNVTGDFPVLVRFHGGGFLSGNGPRKTGPQYLMDEDIIVVMVNYRVGIYGFLSFEDEDMPGNQGMKDQVMALRWVQENIASFGGNPNQVTIIGDSAGGSSVYHHIISPQTEGLFSKAIAESGTSYNNWAIAAPGEARRFALKLLSGLGGKYTTTKDAVEFLKKKDPNEVVSGLELLREWQLDPICNFKPVFESGPDAFLVWPISKWVNKPVPLLMGMASGEGIFRTEYFNLFKMDYAWYSENFDRVAPLSLLYKETSSNQKAVTDVIRKYYLPNENITEKDWLRLTEMYNDGIFAYGILEGANKHSGDVFFYFFDYLGEYSFNGRREKRDPEKVVGAGHTDEIIYLFKQLFIRDFDNLKDEDLVLSKKLVKVWTNFIKFGYPILDQNESKWDRWTPEKHNYMHISEDGFQLKEGLLEERYKVWKNSGFRDLLEV